MFTETELRLLAALVGPLVAEVVSRWFRAALARRMRAI